MLVLSDGIIGVSIPRVDGWEKVTGAARYAADVQLPGLLHGRILRSPLPHARLARVDASRARALDGVRAVVTGADLGGPRMGAVLRDMPVLCDDVVRMVGDPIAAVAADTAEIAEEALRLIEVDYEELPGVFDPVRALEPGAPVLHPGRAAYAGGPTSPDTPNLQGSTGFSRGDVERGFAAADRVFDHTFTIERVHQGYLEPRSSTVQIDEDGTVRVWSSCKVPKRLRALLASLFDLDPERVVVERAAIGGDFGGKGVTGPEPIAYVLARAAGRPVRITRTYAEELGTANPAHPGVIRVRTGVMNDGTLVAREMQVTMDGGAYAGPKVNASLVTPSVAYGLGPYRLTHARLEARFAYTNNVPGGAFRAPGQRQVVFAGESQMDIIAAALGLDPIDFRLQNLVGDGDEWPSGAHYPGVMSRPALELARRASGWDDPLPPVRGRGVAISERGIGAGATGLVVSLHADGTVVATSSAPDTGVGAFTILRQIVAERLHVPVERVTVRGADTSLPLPDAGAGGSKLTYSLTVAAVEATGELNERLAALAAERLECAAGDLEVADGRYRVRGAPDLSVPVEELMVEAAGRAGGVLEARSPGPADPHAGRAPQLCAAVCVAEVAVDPDTGRVSVVKITSVNDVGQSINPLLVQGQVDGGVVQALGGALMEALSAEDGRIVALHLGDYKLPCSADVPELVSAYVEGAEGPGPYAAKAIGEMPGLPVAPALANAIARACGARLLATPLTAERVFQALHPSSHG